LKKRLLYDKLGSLDANIELGKLSSMYRDAATQ
jgi:hypothetical protein